MRPQRGESEDGFIGRRLNNSVSGIENSALVRRRKKERGGKGR